VKNFFVFIVLFCLFVFPTQAAIRDLPKPITGTFYIIDYSVDDPNFTVDKLNQYFAELQAEKIDTVIFSNAPGHIGCYNNSAEDFDWLHDQYRYPNGKSTYENLLEAAYTHNISVYLSNPSYVTTRPDCLDPINNGTHRTYYINKTVALYNQVISLVQSRGWNSSLIAGFYLPETAIRWVDSYIPFYRDFSQSMSTNFSGKHIMVSPYKFANFYDDNPLGCQNGCNDDYGSLYNKVYNLVTSTKVDIIAPQDSVGTFKANYPYLNSEQNRAIGNAVADANRNTGKNAQAWINIETFRCSDYHCAESSLFPASFNQVRWQIQTAYQHSGVSKLITWIHQWDLTTAPVFDNLSAWSNQYTSGRKILRAKLNNDYLTKPIMVAAFPWSASFVLKGFNFGSVGSTVNIYVHYNNGSRSVHFTGQVGAPQDPGKTYNEIWSSLSLLPNFDVSQNYDVAIVNQFN
jgi:hypothetical protein